MGHVVHRHRQLVAPLYRVRLALSALLVSVDVVKTKRKNFFMEIITHPASYETGREPSVKSRKLMPFSGDLCDALSRNYSPTLAQSAEVVCNTKKKTKTKKDMTK